MTNRRRGLIVALGAAIVLLFAGRWGAVFLADRWWAEQFSPAARSFVTRSHLLRLAIDGAAVLLAAGWFIGHLLIAARAVHSVQVPRHVANIEFRETVRARTLLISAVVAGLILGLLLGLDASARWQTVALAWHGVQTGVTEPLLGRDAGIYIAQLPLWRMLHEYAFLLIVVATALVLTLYGVMGAVRVEQRRPAINDHARAHLGTLLAVLAVVLAWGYLLEPFELVASIDGIPSAGEFRLASMVAPALTGTAIMVALLSVLWAVRPRHALLAAGWTVLLIASVGGHHIAPLVMSDETYAPATNSTLRELQDSGFGLGGLEAAAGSPAILPAPLLDRDMVRRIFPELVAVNPAALAVGANQRPVWLVLLTREGGVDSLVAVAADRAGAGGVPLFYRASDTLAYPTPYSIATLQRSASRPGAPRYQLDSTGGVPAAPWPRRAALAWALQAAELLGPMPPNARVDWALEPAARLQRLAPFATWSAVRARIADGRVSWLMDGYVSSQTFPLVEPVAWRGGRANLIRAGFLGVVDAATGDANVYLVEGAGPLAAAWAKVGAGVVRPSAMLPSTIEASAGYPEELFAVQAAIIDHRSDGPGNLAGAGVVTGAGIQSGWDSSGAPLLAAGYVRDGENHVSALLTGSGSNGSLALTPLDSAALPAPQALERSWRRFATFAPVQDSIDAAGARLETGLVRYWSSADGLAALQVHTAARPGARPAIVWVTVATGERLGAGRTFPQAWDNLHGTAAPPPPGSGVGAIAEARHWMRIADEALKRGDWAGFGRAFEALRRVLQPESE